jgi:hypothetical protein
LFDDLFQFKCNQGTLVWRPTCKNKKRGDRKI